MARIVELLFFAIIIYMVYRRLALPFRRGFHEREQERAREQHSRSHGAPKQQSRIDRSRTKDADFKDIT